MVSVCGLTTAQRALNSARYRLPVQAFKSCSMVLGQPPQDKVSFSGSPQPSTTRFGQGNLLDLMVHTQEDGLADVVYDGQLYQPKNAEEVRDLIGHGVFSAKLNTRTNELHLQDRYDATRDVKRLCVLQVDQKPVELFWVGDLGPMPGLMKGFRQTGIGAKLDELREANKVILLKPSENRWLMLPIEQDVCQAVLFWDAKPDRQGYKRVIPAIVRPSQFPPFTIQADISTYIDQGDYRLEPDLDHPYRLVMRFPKSPEDA